MSLQSLNDWRKPTPATTEVVILIKYISVRIFRIPWPVYQFICCAQKSSRTVESEKSALSHACHSSVRENSDVTKMSSESNFMNLTHSFIAFKYQNYKKNSTWKKQGFRVKLLRVLWVWIRGPERGSQRVDKVQSGQERKGWFSGMSPSLT